MLTIVTFSDAFSYLEKRGAEYGIPLADMLEKTPQGALESPSDLIDFWSSKDISHIYPISDYPHLSAEPSNWFPEDPRENTQAGATIRTENDVLNALSDANSDVIDADYDDDGIPDDIDLDVF